MPYAIARLYFHASSIAQEDFVSHIEIVPGVAAGKAARVSVHAATRLHSRRMHVWHISYAFCGRHQYGAPLRPWRYE
eukprot:6190028-Pleurochrysis_carterae.AAC.1